MNIIVFKRAGRKFFEAQWKDPITGKKRTRTTKKTSRRDAERFAALLEKELKNPRTVVERVTWDAFRKQYESEALLGLAKKTVNRHKTVMNKIQKNINPAYLDAITTEEIAKLKKKMYADGLQGYTIKTDLSLIRKMLRWAQERNLVNEIPLIEVPRNVTGKRGRVITQEEFDRILDKVEAVVGKEGAESWKFLLNGLWWGGLRIGEALSLHWTDDSNITVDFSGKRPMFNIQEHAEKARKGGPLPMAPEFANLTSDVKRSGFVFSPTRRLAPKYGRMSDDHIGKVISEIGEKANVKVSEINGKPKFASAHDFRRSFGFRWAMRVSTPVLMEMMRHESISTTMKFYVGRNAQVAADAAWDAVAGITDTPANTEEIPHNPNDVNEGN